MLASGTNPGSRGPVVVRTDILACRSFVHVIDGVLLPETLPVEMPPLPGSEVAEPVAAPVFDYAEAPYNEYSEGPGGAAVGVYEPEH